MIEQIRYKYTQIPSGVRVFLIKALLLFVLWELLYHFIFLPTGVPDKQLKLIVGWLASKMLVPFYGDVYSVDAGYTACIIMNGKPTLGIAAACTGLEVMALYIGVLFCLPTANRTRLWVFLFGGIAGIIVLNAIRCSLLAWVKTDHEMLFDLAHKWIFKLALYFAVFYGWVLYTKTNAKQNVQAKLLACISSHYHT